MVAFRDKQDRMFPVEQLCSGGFDDPLPDSAFTPYNDQKGWVRWGQVFVYTGDNPEDKPFLVIDCLVKPIKVDHRERMSMRAAEGTFVRWRVDESGKWEEWISQKVHIGSDKIYAMNTDANMDLGGFSNSLPADPINFQVFKDTISWAIEKAIGGW